MGLHLRLRPTCSMIFHASCNGMFREGSSPDSSWSRPSPRWSRYGDCIANRIKTRRSLVMSKLAWIGFFAILTAAPASAQTAIPDLRGTWKGNSESIILGAGNPHHAAAPSDQPRLNSVAFTATIDKQDGRRFSGTFSSLRGADQAALVVLPVRQASGLSCKWTNGGEGWRALRDSNPCFRRERAMS